MDARRTNRGVGSPHRLPDSPALFALTGLTGSGVSLVSAAETVSNLIFTGPLTWTDDAACRGQNELFFAPAGERPETRSVREAKARAVCTTCAVLSAVPPVGPREPRVRLLGWRVRRGARRRRLPRRHARRPGRPVPQGQRHPRRAPRPRVA